MSRISDHRFRGVPGLRPWVRPELHRLDVPDLTDAGTVLYQAETQHGSASSYGTVTS